MRSHQALWGFYDSHTHTCPESFNLWVKMLTVQGHRISVQFNQMISQPGEPTNPGNARKLALICTAGPNEACDPVKAIQWAKQAAYIGDGVNGRRTYALGMAYLRAGQYEKAIHAFRESNNIGWNSEVEHAPNWFAMAIAHHQLQQNHQAQNCFDNACKLMRRAQPNGVAEWFVNVTPLDWLAMQTLRREAEAINPSWAKLDQNR